MRHMIHHSRSYFSSNQTIPRPLFWNIYTFTENKICEAENVGSYQYSLCTQNFACTTFKSYCPDFFL